MLSSAAIMFSTSIHNSQLNPSVLNLYIALLVLCTVFATTRILTRALDLKAFGVDDGEDPCPNPRHTPDHWLIDTNSLLHPCVGGNRSAYFLFHPRSVASLIHQALPLF